MKQYFTWFLFVCVTGIYVYVATFAFFLIYKEFVCAKNLNGHDCLETYSEFMLRPAGILAGKNSEAQTATSTKH